MLTLFLLTAATGGPARRRTGAARAKRGPLAGRLPRNSMPPGALSEADGSLPLDTFDEVVEIGDPLC
jgi:hypothetical protein